ncbi:MAG: TraR/DksA C4-type zinc finger protein [Candidatus Taylorbacteria bacterium]|nr:TraR/DksA C4-type zinc finger protein [Candidatus Taylorbacteria bacterium]
MNKNDLEKFKNKLLEEKKLLEGELEGIGKKDKASVGGWDATGGTIEIDPADENEVADKLEEIDENSGIVGNLENQLNEVTAALDRIEKGTYGICEKTGVPIEKERLEANPSARFSIKQNK